MNARVCVPVPAKCSEGNGGDEVFGALSPESRSHRNEESAFPPQGARVARQTAHQDRQNQTCGPAGWPWPAQELGQPGGQEADSSPPPGLSGVRQTVL